LCSKDSACGAANHQFSRAREPADGRSGRDAPFLAQTGHHRRHGEPDGERENLDSGDRAALGSGIHSVSAKVWNTSIESHSARTLACPRYPKWRRERRCGRSGPVRTPRPLLRRHRCRRAPNSRKATRNAGGGGRTQHLACGVTSTRRPPPPAASNPGETRPAAARTAECPLNDRPRSAEAEPPAARRPPQA
jgi:hypothetical protein